MRAQTTQCTIMQNQLHKCATIEALGYGDKDLSLDLGTCTIVNTALSLNCKNFPVFCKINTPALNKSGRNLNGSNLTELTLS